MTQKAPHPFERPSSPAAELAFVVGGNVERYRTAARLNKKTLCLMAGISRPFLNRIENGCADVRIGTLAALAGALGVTVVDLLAPPEKVDSVNG